MKKFKLLTLLGIRPDIIRMFKLIHLLDEGAKGGEFEHIFAHTGQHFDFELDEVFYKELGVRKPEYNLGVGKTLAESGGPTTHAYQAALLFQKTSELIEAHKPDAIMYLGDTNSVLSSVVVARSSVPVIHIEAGGRSYDWRMPEEKNRIVIDHLSDALYCYMPRHQEILMQEGIDKHRTTVIGNLIYDALDTFLPKAEESGILESLALESGKYVLVTLHREENISNPEVLTEKISELVSLSEKYKVVFPLMPRVRKNLATFGLEEKIEQSNIITTKPLGYLPFLKLQKHAALIITDSGTVQEEACILGVPAVIARRSTERPETMAVGASILSEHDLIGNAEKALSLPKGWDRNVLNPTGQSPSDNLYADLVARIKNDYFSSSRQYDSLKDNKFAQEAYGKS